MRKEFGRKHRGLTVALLGLDGAGKSTLASALEESAALPVRSIYMGYNMLPRVALLPVPFLRDVVFLLLLELRYATALYHKVRGRVVVFDRYVYDSILPPRRKLSWFGRVRRWIWAHVCPPADLVIILDVPGEVAYARKGEYNSQELEAQRQVLLGLRRRVPRLLIVDASRSRETVRSEVLAYIRQQYVAG